MVGESNQHVFLIQIHVDASNFAEFEILRVRDSTVTKFSEGLLYIHLIRLSVMKMDIPLFVQLMGPVSHYV